eukprot:3900911-Pleurochrysis_carterae.AAC.2
MIAVLIAICQDRIFPCCVGRTRRRGGVSKDAAECMHELSACRVVNRVASVFKESNARVRQTTTHVLDAAITLPLADRPRLTRNPHVQREVKFAPCVGRVRREHLPRTLAVA